MIGEVSPLPTVLAIAEKVKQSIKFIIDDDLPRTESMVHEFIDVKGKTLSSLMCHNQL